MKQTTLWILIVGVILLACGLYLFRHSGGDLNVEPHAAEEIEKAKRQ